MYSSNRNEAPAAPKTSEKKPPAPASKPSTTPSAPPAPAAAAAAATQTQSSTTPSKTESKSNEKQPEKELDWKKHVKEFDLQEEATVNGINLLFFIF